MAAPPVTVAVEPVVGGKLVYQPTAPLSPSGEPGARVMVELSITNTTGKAFTATSLVIDYASTTDPWTSTRTINMVVGPWSSLVWNPAQGIDGDLFTLSSIPTSATLSVFFTGYADPIKATYPLAAHVGPDKIGPYRFPSQAKDLALGEFWQVNGAGHNPGNHQSFAYDMGVWGTDHGKDAAYSELRTGGDAYAKKAPNSDYRIWGKPVRAMAEGEVIEIVNNCPSNTPLYPADPADMPGLMDGLKATYGAYVNGEGGNHVLIRHGDEVAMYAHMQPGSIDPSLKARKPAVGSKPAVPGSPVTPGQFLGLAGNSGRSSAPHLHIHSTQPPYPTGGTRPMLFTGAWTINNDTVAGVGYPPKLTGDPGGNWVPLNGTGVPAGYSSAGSDVFLLPSGTPRWPEVVRYSVEENDYQAVFDDMAGKGMAPAWINTHTIQKGPTYFYTFFNVVFRPSLGRNEPTVHGVDRTGFESIRKDLVDKQGFHVTQLESYFSMRQSKQLFAARFAKYGTIRPRKDPRTYHAKTYTEHAQLASAWTLEGFSPTNVSVVSVNDTLSYSALWEYHSDQVISMEEHVTHADLQSRFDAHKSNGRFLTYLKGYFHKGTTQYSAIWIGGAPNVPVKTELRLDTFGAAVTEQRQHNHLLRSISGCQLDGDAAYAGIFEA